MLLTPDVVVSRGTRHSPFAGPREPPPGPDDRHPDDHVRRHLDAAKRQIGEGGRPRHPRGQARLLTTAGRRQLVDRPPEHQTELARQTRGEVARADRPGLDPHVGPIPPVGLGPSLPPPDVDPVKHPAAGLRQVMPVESDDPLLISPALGFEDVLDHRLDRLGGGVLGLFRHEPQGPLGGAPLEQRHDERVEVVGEPDREPTSLVRLARGAGDRHLDLVGRHLRHHPGIGPHLRVEPVLPLRQVAPGELGDHHQLGGIRGPADRLDRHEHPSKDLHARARREHAHGEGGRLHPVANLGTQRQHVVEHVFDSRVGV